MDRTSDQIHFKKMRETLIAFNLGIQTGLNLLEEVERLSPEIRSEFIKDLRRDIAKELAGYATRATVRLIERGAEEFGTEPMFITLGGRKVEKVYCT